MFRQIVIAIASGGSASPKTMEIFAAGANIRLQKPHFLDALSRLRQRLRRAKAQRIPPFSD
jgi:hypothetical protein